MRRHENGESVDSFITALYELAEHCGYENLNDEMIRDRLVVGLGDSKLSEKLQLDPELALKKAITQVHQAVTVKQQQPLLQGESTHRSFPETTIGTVHKNKKTTTSKTVTGQQKSEQRQRSTNNVGTCSHCGKSPFHDCKKCAAHEVVCHKCGRKGHFQSVCRPANVRVHTSNSQPSDDNFQGVVTLDEKTDDPWTATLQLNNAPVEFHIDTGAKVTVVSETIHKKVGSPSLTQSDQTPRGISNHSLPLKGNFWTVSVW